MPNHDEQHEPADDGDRPDEAELVGDDGEDEVAVGERQVAELAVAGADARPGEPAVGDRQEALVRLVREVVAVAGDVEERREPLVAVLGREDERRAPRRPRPAPVASIGDSGTPPMKATASTIAHITIAEPRSPCTRQAPAAHDADEGDRAQAAADVGEHVLAAHEQVGANTTSASLRNSDGCRLNEPTVIHALASLTVDADAGHERQGHPDAGEDDERDRQPAHPREVHAHARRASRRGRSPPTSPGG